MYDSVNPGSIPAGAQIVAGYVDGTFANFDAMVADFPHAYHVSITVLGRPNARVCDCETGDLSPASAAAWAKGEVEAGRRPTIYSTVSSYPDVAAALAAQGLSFGKDVDWWAAGYTFTPYLAAGSVATQWSGGITAPYDISDTNGTWPTVTAPIPAPTGGGARMDSAAKSIALKPDGTGYWIVSQTGSVYALGAAVYHGGANTLKLKAPIVGIAATPSGNGYWLVGADGGVFAYGDAGFFGSAGNINLAAPIVAIVPTESGRGYLLLGSDGGVFCYGDASFEGAA